jgi:hypothetical protein
MKKINSTWKGSQQRWLLAIFAAYFFAGCASKDQGDKRIGESCDVQKDCAEDAFCGKPEIGESICLPEKSECSPGDDEACGDFLCREVGTVGYCIRDCVDELDCKDGAVCLSDGYCYALPTGDGDGDTNAGPHPRTGSTECSASGASEHCYPYNCSASADRCYTSCTDEWHCWPGYGFFCINNICDLP